MNRPSNASPGIFQRCPHLGLQDDRSTSLAYPSTWNYCYRADPPHSVLLAHQEAVCLTGAHRQCPVFLHVAGEPLPAEVRGFPETPGKKNNWLGRLFLLLVLVMIAGAVVLIGPRYFAALTPSSVASS